MNSALGHVRRFVPGNLILRATISVTLGTALWWFVLKGATLFLLRTLGSLALGLLIAPVGYDAISVNPQTGEWVFNVAISADVRNPQSGEEKHVNSVEFAADKDKDNVAFFAVGWVSYLALAFSANAFSKGQRKRLAKGLLLQTGINILSLTLYVYISAYGSVINSPAAASEVWWLRYCYHIIYLVVPFAGPFAVALLMHPQWRDYFRIPNSALRAAHS